MKLNFYYHLLLLAIVGLFSFSCDKKDPVDGPEELNTKLEISISGDLTKEFVADIEVNDYDQIYIIGMISSSLYESEMNGSAEDYAYYLIDFAQASGSQLSKPDNKYIFKGDSRVDLKSTWEPTFGTDYIVAAFGVTAEGEVSTEITTSEVAAQAEPETPFELNIEGTSINNLAVEVNVESSFAADYMVGVVKKSFFEGSLASKKDLIPGLVMAEIAIKTGGVYDASTGYVFNGSQSVDLAKLWDLEKNTEYVVAAFGLDRYTDDTGSEIINYEPYTVEIAMVSTDDAGLPIINVEGADTPDYSGFSINVSKDNAIDYFFVALMTSAEYYSTYSNDAAAAAAGYLELNMGGTDIEDYSTMIGVLPVFADGGVVNLRLYYASVFAPSTSYTALVFGIDTAGNITSEVSEYKATTGESPFIEDVTFDISVVGEASAKEFVVSVSPSSDDFNYLVCAIEKKAFDPLSGWFLNFDTLAPDYAAGAKSWVDDLSLWYPDIEDEDEEPEYVDMGEANGITVFSGDAPEVDILYARATEVKPATDYVVMAFGVTASGTIITDITTFDVTLADTEKTDVNFDFDVVTPVAEGDFGYGGALMVTPSDPNIKYCITIVTASSADGKTDQEIFDDNRLGMVAPYSLVSGAQKYEYSFIYENSYIIAFGYEGGMTTPISKFLVEVPAAE